MVLKKLTKLTKIDKIDDYKKVLMELSADLKHSNTLPFGLHD
jgi:hypothetical protein